MLAAQVNPVMVRVVEAPTPETSVADVLMGAVGFVGFVLISAFVVGLLAGGAFIWIRTQRERRQGNVTQASASPLTR